jgi:hypothetical protein
MPADPPNHAVPPDIHALADEFLRLVVVSYGQAGEPDPTAWRQAEILLAEHPALRDASIHVDAAIGDTGRLQAWLDRDPALVNATGGPFAWPPLMYAAYARLPGVSTLAAGKLLLERGADPNAHAILQGRYRFTALTGVFGQGEAGPARAPGLRAVRPRAAGRRRRPERQPSRLQSHVPARRHVPGVADRVRPRPARHEQLDATG